MLLAVAATGCMPPEDLASPAVPEVAAPEVRVSLAASVSRVTLSGPTGLRVIDGTGTTAWEIAPAVRVTARVDGDLVFLAGPDGELSLPVGVLLPADSLGTVLVSDRAYRGRIELSRGGDGVRVINRVPLEEYLIAVVGAEMGRRSEEEMAALEAQAVASRTYALRNLGRFDSAGFDLTADVASQVYRGVASEFPLAALAVERTRGQILTYDGAPIDAFFSSTCGGVSETAAAAFSADRPYLVSTPDISPEGSAWCASSPRFRWRQGWDAAEIAATLRRTLAAERLSGARAGDLREVRVLDRSGAGRINALELVGGGGRTVVRGANTIRRVFEPPSGGMLPSADFTVRISRQGGRLERLDADGRGYGHGVGMCQWGAIGRARAGQDYRTILGDYYPGAELTQAY